MLSIIIHTICIVVTLSLYIVITTAPLALVVGAMILSVLSLTLVIVFQLSTKKRTNKKGANSIPYRLLEIIEIALIASTLYAVSNLQLLALAIPLLYMSIRYTQGPSSILTDSIMLSSGSIIFSISLRTQDSFPGLLIILVASAVIILIVKYRKEMGMWLGILPKKEETLSHKAYDRMLATLAHEIRTPLTIMQTTENVLIEQIPGPLNDRQKKFLESIYINTQRLITFSENMLTLLKLEQDWRPDLSKTIDLRILTRQVIEMVQPMVQLRNQKIRYTFPSMAAHPRADEAWIRQVLVNLIHNASKHTEEHGTIMISLTQDDEQVVVTVSDNGQGLEGEGRETLFKEFYQEEHELKTYQDGFGLGLSIVRAIIEKHHGNVYITSSKNLGTMVSFNLPAKALE